MTGPKIFACVSHVSQTARASHFFLNNLHVGTCVGENSRLDPITTVTLCPFLPARHDPSALLFA